MKKKINSRWIKDFCITPENIGGKLLEVKSWQWFYGLDNKSKNKQLYQSKKFLSSKGNSTI